MSFIEIFLRSWREHIGISIKLMVALVNVVISLLFQASWIIRSIVVLERVLAQRTEAIDDKD